MRVLGAGDLQDFPQKQVLNHHRPLVDNHINDIAVQLTAVQFAADDSDMILDPGIR